MFEPFLIEIAQPLIAGIGKSCPCNISHLKSTFLTPFFFKSVKFEAVEELPILFYIYTRMASKIPGFTSGLKPPSTSSSLSSLVKRRVPEVLSNQATDSKRIRTTDDATGKLEEVVLFLCILLTSFAS